VNSITLAMFDYTDRQSETEYNQILNKFEATFVAIYAGEALLRIIAYGFVVSKHSYMRDFWNVLDFVVVLTG
jgi:hypothetical protein